MPKASPIQTSFNAGELSPRLDGRIDLDKYRNGCSTLENFLPMIHGGVVKRSGTRFVKEVKDSSDSTVLIPFEFSTTQAYVLEFGDLYMRVYRNGSVVLEAAQTITSISQANPAVVAVTAHGYSNGDQVYITGVGGMTEVNGKFFTVANVTAGTFELSGIDSTGYGAYVSGGTASKVFELTTTYATADVKQLQFAQSADVLYIAHENYPPRKISRTGHTSWTITTIDFDWQPFLDENISTTTIYASAATGAGITLTASAATFTSDMVNGYVKLREIPASKHDPWETATVYAASATVTHEGNVYKTTAGGTSGTRPPIHDTGTESDGGVTDWAFQHPASGYVKIVGFTSSTSVTADVVKQLPGSVVGAGGATERWSLGAWSDEHGYPKTVAFYEDRLLWAGSTNNPQTIWGSKSGDYENHEQGTADDDAYNYTINSDQVNAIEWMSPGKVLMIGTAGGEFAMSGSTVAEAITPTNVRVAIQTTYGSKAIRAKRVGNAVLFVQRAGKKVRELVYDFDSDAYQAPDMTLLSEHITKDGITDMAYQQEPNQLLWAARTDGELICMTYERSESVVGWHRHPIAGTSTVVESLAVIPHPDGDQDQLWMVVKRTINGATKRYVEYLEKEWKSTGVTGDEFFIDSGLTYSGASTTTITNLDHLEGETVSILAGGATHADKTVTSGSVTLDRAVTKAQIGLGYNATLKTMRIEAGAADGTSQGKTKRLNNIVIRMYQTGGGLWYGPNTTDMDEVQFRDPSMAMDTPIPLYNGDKGPYVWPGQYEKDGYITIQHRLPLPCSIIALMPQLTTQDR